MLRKYRQNFVVLNMTLVGITLLLTLTVLCFYMHGAYQDNLKITMSELLKPLSSAAPGPAGFPDVRTEDIDRQRILTVIYRGDTGHVTLLSQLSSVEVASLDDAVRAAYNADGAFGVLPDLGLFYYKEQANDDWKIALTDQGYITDLMTKLIVTAILIFLGAMSLFFLISLVTARRVSRPVEEAWARERRFIADASHELKTPLTVMLANISILRFKPELQVADQMRWIDSMEITARSMRGLVEDMLALSELDATSAETKKSCVDLSDIVTRAVLQFDAVAYDKGICLNTQIEDAVVLDCHADCMMRIVSVLLENALKYEPPGGTVTVALERRRNETVLTVQNKSSCIDPADIPYIFDRFYRANPDTDGHGLGLSIAKQMAEAEGGSLVAQSSPETGTTFLAVFK